MKNHKIVYYGPRDIRVETADETLSCGAGDILVRVEACAVCGSDIKTYLHGNPRMKPQTTPGHELCGEIIEVGEGVNAYRIGQRVTMATSIGCGQCDYCKAGKTNLCKSLEAIGFHMNGAMANYVLIPEKAVSQKYVVPVGDLEPEVACLSEPMSCVVNGLARIPLTAVKHAVIIGMGTLGIFHALALRDAGVQNIVCVVSPGMKQQIVDELGFTNRTPEEFEQSYLDLSQSDGFDLIIITAPSNKVQSEALKYARKGAYVSYFASLPVGDNMITIDSRLLHYNELFLFGTSDSTPEHVASGLKILTRNKESIKKFITVLPMHRYPDAIDGVLSKRYAKVVLIPESQE